MSLRFEDLSSLIQVLVSLDRVENDLIRRETYLNLGKHSSILWDLQQCDCRLDSMRFFLSVYFN